MTKPRIQSLTTFGLLVLILSIALITFSTRAQGAAQIFPATINRDCAPWDGAAFTLSIPLEDGTALHVSIWNAPDIKFPVTFSFPDDTGQIGNALLIQQGDLPDQLTGNVFFSRVNQEKPVEGNFDLRDENGKQFKGKFKAEWGNQVMLCG